MIKLSVKKIAFLFLLLAINTPAFAIKEIKKPTKPVLTDNNQNQLKELILINKTIGKELVKAINAQKLIVQPHTNLQISQMASWGYCKVSGYRAFASKELLALLYALVNSPEITKKTPMGLLSLFRIGRAHGAVQSNGTMIGRAIDIDSYGGYKIHIKNPEKALSGILKIIDKLPPWRYVLGLPRPGGGRLIDPAKDFFLPVTSLSQNERSPTGSLPGDLKLIKNEAAKQKITKAIEKNKNAKILFLMPDAVDHLHIKAVALGSIQ
jgi:hypothetical protein